MKATAPEMTHVETGYAYPSSVLASAWGMREAGCWFVRALAENSMAAADTRVLSVHATKEEAVAAAHCSKLTPAYWMLADWQERQGITGHGCMSAYEPAQLEAQTDADISAETARAAEAVKKAAQRAAMLEKLNSRLTGKGPDLTGQGELFAIDADLTNGPSAEELNRRALS